MSAPAQVAGPAAETVSNVACRRDQMFCPDNGLMSAAGMQDMAIQMQVREMLKPLSVLMFAGSAVLLLRDLLMPSGHIGLACFAAVLVIAVSTVVLFSTVRLALVALRGLEVILCGAMGGHLLLLEQRAIGQQVASADSAMLLATLSVTALAFVVLIAAYVLFIPGTWLRATGMTIPLAVAPVGVPLLVPGAGADAVVRALRVGELNGVIILVALGAMVAIMGSVFMGRFRAAAHKAYVESRYSLSEQIGIGGMGEVWRAEHPVLARPAAIKIIRPEIVDSTDRKLAQMAVRRFEREAQATAALRSPNTVEVYDFGLTNDGTFYYVMEYLDGLDLETLVHRHGPLPVARAVHLLRQICASLADAHAHGLTHRDIKPANVFACRMGQEHDFVKVLDFGLVKQHKASGEADSMLTVDGLTTGTPAYMAPELALRDHPIGPATDIYAVGCLAYWLVTGALVFDQETPMAIVVDHVKSEPIEPSRRTELEIPPELDTVILKCLAKTPADRFGSMRELSEALAAVPAAGDPWDASRAEAWWLLHRPEEEETQRVGSQPASGQSGFAGRARAR